MCRWSSRTASGTKPAGKLPSRRPAAPWAAPLKHTAAANWACWSLRAPRTKSIIWPPAWPAPWAVKTLITACVFWTFPTRTAGVASSTWPAKSCPRPTPFFWSAAISAMSSPFTVSACAPPGAWAGQKLPTSTALPLTSILTLSSGSSCRRRPWLTPLGALPAPRPRSEEHTSELQSRGHLHSFPTRRSSDLAVFLVGSNIRHEQPIYGQRVRAAWRLGGAKIADLNSIAFDFHFDLEQRLIVPPQAMVDTFGRVARAAAELTDTALPDGPLGDFLKERHPENETRQVAAMLRESASGILLLGDQALNHPESGWLRTIAEWTSKTLEVALMVLPGPANSEGAWRAGSVPGPQGLNARAMLEKGRRAYLLWDIEPDLDLADPSTAAAALENASSVVAASAYDNELLRQTADVLLPLAPAPETDGTWINADGHEESLAAVGRPVGQARAGWKILRLLGERLGAAGFDFATLDEVTGKALAGTAPEQPAARLETPFEGTGETLWRTGEVPIYAGDSLLRRSQPLT